MRLGPTVACIAGLVLAALSCTRDHPCRPDTLFLTLTLVDPTLTDLDVEISTEGAASVSGTVHWPNGAAEQTLEIDFPTGYPTGQLLTVHARARQGGDVLAEGDASQVLAAGCDTLGVQLSTAVAELPDEGVADLAEPQISADLAGDDLAMPADLATPCVASPLAPLATVAVPSAVDAVVCGLGNGLANDAKVVGLDLKFGGTAVSLGGRNVTACAGFDFGTVRAISPVVVRARRATSACGIACTGSACNTGDSAYVFTASSLGTFTYVSTIALNAALTDASILLASPTRYIIVCRAGNAAARDDVEIDLVQGTLCQ